ncbi:NADP-dependent malic enzyme [Candidatus Roizmanbacteria bacterium]|nr:NADP-dependent malic enzyme [Candidatus Roizmanbacteria bacterium]
MNITQEAMALHRTHNGKLGIASKVPLRNKKDLALVYTPGVAEVSSYIAKHKNEVGEYTMKKRAVAVISDGSAVLGLGNIGPEGALPVMEGKCLLFKRFANIDAFPIVLSTQDPDEIIAAVKAIAPTFGGINLEDIKAPQCFEVEARLKKELAIPVIHDDQWGAATAVLAGLLNALKITNRDIATAKIVISGAGAAGSAIGKILTKKGAKQIIMCDRAGAIYANREGNTEEKEALAAFTNPQGIPGSLGQVLTGADVFIGVSQPNILSTDMVKTMNAKSIIFALANPTPEIMPQVAKAAGAYIVATGRSDFRNQVNNALIFPGIFKGALEKQIKEVTLEMFIRAAENLAALVTHPTPSKIIPSVFDQDVVEAVSKAVK